MPVDLAILGTTIVTQLLLPYIKEGGKKIADKLTEKVSDAAAEGTINVMQQAWDKVKSVFSSDKDKGTLEDFEKYPEETKNLLKRKLVEKMEQDAALKGFFEELMNKPVSEDGVTTGAQIIGAHIAGIADVRGANFSGSQRPQIGGVIQNYGSSENDPQNTDK